jgi:hypothetical protein
MTKESAWRKKPSTRRVKNARPATGCGTRVSDQGALLDKTRVNETSDPLAVFSEWSSKADEKAYADL